MQRFNLPGNPYHMPVLLYKTPAAWVKCVLDDFSAFLRDHAAAEKKASGMAISMLSHYPDRTELVEAMAELAIEEMAHYREVVKLIHRRGEITGKDEKDLYINEFRKTMRKESEQYFLDRMLIAGIIEARGAERFGLLAQALEPGELKTFYQLISRSEEKHINLFIDLAGRYFHTDVIQPRLDELLTLEADIVRKLPIRPALH
jgi:tRNA-(ms[2]io[6]A)-hydroxylase